MCVWIQAGRQEPGLLRQFRTALDAAMAKGGAEEGRATPGLPALEFRPGAVAPDREDSARGSAASARGLLVVEKALARGFCENRINAEYVFQFKGPYGISVQNKPMADWISLPTSSPPC
jgi:RNA 3'-terminal phosphate cyclase